jgi:hypothetical protein
MTAESVRPLCGNVKDISGQRFTMLLVLFAVGRDARRNIIWRCKCDCGKEAEFIASALIHNLKRSCGCSPLREQHRQTGTKAYRCWKGIISRCCDPNHSAYARYGGRGITICERWRLSFTDFLTDMGQPTSEKHSIDRINNNGNYEPDNCRWADIHTQLRNYSANVWIELDGVRLIGVDWEKITGVKYRTVRYRLSRGWPTQKALTFRPTLPALGIQEFFAASKNLGTPSCAPGSKQ